MRVSWESVTLSRTMRSLCTSASLVKFDSASDDKLLPPRTNLQENGFANNACKSSENYKHIKFHVWDENIQLVLYNYSLATDWSARCHMITTAQVPTCICTAWSTRCHMITGMPHGGGMYTYCSMFHMQSFPEPCSCFHFHRPKLITKPHIKLLCFCVCAHTLSPSLLGWPANQPEL